MRRRGRIESRRSARLAAAAIGATLLVLALAAAAWGVFGRGPSVFGGDGRVLTQFEVHPQGSGKIEDLAVGLDGRIALATSGNQAQPIQLAVLHADGSPARSFSGDGLLQPQLEPRRPFLSEPVRIALAGRGRNAALLVAGIVEKQGHKTLVEIRRYLADGRPDPRFGHDGVVDSRGAEVVALFAAPDGTFILFSNKSVEQSSLDPGVVGRYGPRGALLGPPSKNRSPFRQVTAGTGGGFLAEVGWTRKQTALLRIDAQGRIVSGATPPVAGRARFRLLGEDARGRALGRLAGSLVRLSSDDLTVDPGFAGELPPCEKGGQSLRPDRVLAEPSGGILVVDDCGLARLGPDGSADPSFAGGGYVTAAADASGLALRPGRTVLFARWRGSGSLPTVARVDHGGAPDRDFGAGGQVGLRLPAPRVSRAAALVSVEGRLLAAGTALCGSGCERFALARYRARTGRLDRSFAQGGKVLGARGFGSARAIAVAPGGDIVAVGSTPEAGIPPDKERAFILERFHSSGGPDMRFGKRGIVVKQLAQGRGRSEANGVAVQGDGSIVVAGLASCPRFDICFTVARFLPDGSLDRSFGHDGIFRLDRGLEAIAVAIDSEGRSVVTGSSGGFFETVRLTRQGRLDHSFGRGGLVIHRHRVRFKGLLDYSIGPKALALGADGSITVAGGSERSRSVFERYLPDGRRDRSFGHGGRLLVQRFHVTALAASSCGIVAAGSVNLPRREIQMAVTGLDRNGRIHSPPLPLFPANRRSSGAAVALADGRAIVAGSRRAFPLSSEFALAAYPLGDLMPRC